MSENKKPFEKRKVKCPECGKEVEIFNGTEQSGMCDCGIDVDAVYRRAHYDKLANKVKDGEPEPEPTPKPKQKKDDPFSFRM